MAKEPAHVWAQRLCLSAKAGDKRAMNTLISRCWGLLASKYRGMDIEDEERIQLARTTVWKAVLRYNPDRGASFMSYLHFYGTQHLLRYLRIHKLYESRFEEVRRRLAYLGTSEEAPDDIEAGIKAAEFYEAESKAKEILSPREAVIMSGTLDGLNQNELASTLGVSHTTVQNELRNVVVCMQKLLEVEPSGKVVRRDRSDMIRWRAAHRGVENARRRELYAQKKAKANDL